MIILSAKDITKEYGMDVILDGITFSINAGQRVGLVGANGAGKTTLLDILAGNISPTSGQIFLSAGVSLGYLRQKDDFSSERSVIEEAEEIFKDLMDMENEMERLSHLAAGLSGQDQREALEKYEELREQYDRRGGYRFRSDVRGILTSMALGEEYFDKPISTLSGGERTRLAMAMLLMKQPDVLLLDEPTNHLDIGTLKWLEQYLAQYRGTMIVVSHDRYFLNETVDHIMEIEGHCLTQYTGNYDAFAQRKKELREEELRRASHRQAEIRRQEDMIRIMKQRGTEKLAKRAASREKMLEKMQPVDVAPKAQGRMKINFKEKYKSGNDVLLMEDVSKSFGYGRDEKRLFANVNMDVKRGEKICIVGANGIGKTTLIRIINGELGPGTGHIKTGHNVKIAYYDQTQSYLNEENTVFDEMKDAYHLYTDTEMRTILGRFLFRGDDVFLNISSLSGGEKARLALLKMMLSGANLLLLDEPTNHLDMESKEVFEDALMEFPGTALIISHDRYLLSRVPTRIMELTADGLVEYLGKYDYYVEKKEKLGSGTAYLDELGAGAAKYGAGEKDAVTAGGLSSAEERRLKKEEEANARRQAREKEKLEEQITTLEIRIHEIEEEMCTEDALSDYLRLDALGRELDQAKASLDACYNQWMQHEIEGYSFA